MSKKFKTYGRKQGGRITWPDVKKRHSFQINAGLIMDWDRKLTEPEWRQIWRDYGQRTTSKYIQSNPGKRPYIWWRFEQNMETPRGYRSEEKLLRELGLLTDFEERRLEFLRSPEPELTDN